ncbi:MAG: rhodanese-like domain-containing protein [Thermodesulfobacteriota bacterium]
MSRRGLCRQDLAWAAFLLVLAAAFGLVKHWPLVNLSFQGKLAAHLEEMRAQRRQVQFQGVRTLNLSQAYELFQKGQSLFIDARKPEEYQELHIAGAVNLSPEKVQRGDNPALTGIAKERQIVVYCGEAHCDIALKVAEKMQALGFTQVAAFLGGFKAWDEAGYPVDTSK